MVIRPLIKASFVCSVVCSLFLVHSAVAQYKNERYASLERSKAAVGHYARARAMLVRALQEFEEGRKLARPDLLLDSDEWRLSIISRAEELNRVLDPKPRVVKGGVRFSASPLKVQRKKQQLPPLEIGPASTNTQGEDEWKRQKEIEAVRARMTEVTKQFEAPKEPEPVYLTPEPVPVPPQEEISKQVEEVIQEEIAKDPNALSVEDIIPEDLPMPEAEVDPNEDVSAPTLFGSNPSNGEEKEFEQVVDDNKTEKQVEAVDEGYDDDAAISQAIERSIKERLMKINSGN